MNENTSKVAALSLNENETSSRVQQEHCDANDSFRYLETASNLRPVNTTENEHQGAFNKSLKETRYIEVSEATGACFQENISSQNARNVENSTASDSGSETRGRASNGIRKELDEDSEDSDFEDELIAMLQKQIDKDINDKVFGRAEKSLTKLVSLRAGIEWQWKLCACLEAQKKWEEAIKLLESLDDDEPRIYHHLSIAYLELPVKDYETASFYCKKALRGRKKLGKDDSYYASMAVMADILAATGQTVEGDTYRAIIKKRQPQFRPVSESLSTQGSSTGQLQIMGNKTVFWDAVSRHNLDSMQKEISLGVDTRADSGHEQELFWAALEKSPPEIVDLLTPANFHLRKLGPPVLKNEPERLLSPIGYATEIGREDILNLLLAQGYDLRELDNHGRPIYFYAAAVGQTLILSNLIARGVDINYQDSGTGRTLLCIASWKGHEPVVKYLLENGASINKSRKGGFTPLYVASQKGHEPVVKVLLDNGASIDKARKDGTTPLYVASHKGHEAVVKLLLNEGASIDQPDNSGITPLSIASQEGHGAVVKLLLKKGASIDQPDNSGFTPLYIASQEGHEAIVKLLLDKDASIDKSAKGGFTPLYVASQEGHEPVVRLLLNEGASTDKSRKDGITPLYIASHKGHEAIVKLLLNEGASIDHPDNSGISQRLSI